MQEQDEPITREDLELAAKMTDEQVEHSPPWMKDIRDLARKALARLDNGEATIETINLPRAM